MDAALVAANFALGIASAPHCVAMCAAPCHGLTRGAAKPTAAFHAGRLASYAAGGALVSASLTAFSAFSQLAPAVRPLWWMLQAAVVLIGVWWLFTGREWGAALPATSNFHPVLLTKSIASNTERSCQRAAAAGLAWLAWPCGMLQTALVVASQTSGAWAGAASMAAFATASAPALGLAQWVQRRWTRTASRESWTRRLAGLCLVASGSWAIGYGIWPSIAAWCA